MSCRIRPARDGDIPHVHRLIRGLAEYERKLDEAVATENDLRGLLCGCNSRAEALLAEVGAVPAAGSPSVLPPVGVAVFYYTVSTFAGRAGLFLEDLFVEPAHRGGGVGLALLRHLAARAVAERCDSVAWRVLDWNRPAINFYDRIGGDPISGWHTRQLKGKALVALAEGTFDG